MKPKSWEPGAGQRTGYRVARLRLLLLIPVLALAPAPAIAYPKAPCDEVDAERGTIEEWAIGLSADGTRVAVVSTFEPENGICAPGRDEAVVRDVETGKVLWRGRYSGPSPGGEQRPSLEQGFPAAVVARYQLIVPRRAEAKFPDFEHRSPRGANDRVARGVGDDGRAFEIVLPSIPDTLAEVWIASDRLALVFEVNKGSRLGNVTTQAIVFVPIRPQSSPAAYEALRARVRAASDPRNALQLIAKEAYREAENPFAAAALVGQIALPPEASQAPEAYLAAAGDMTLYLSRMKEAGAEGCLYLATNTLENRALNAPALAKLRKAIEHNLRLCKRYAHPSPEGPPR